jgi:hypothetical protein
VEIEIEIYKGKMGIKRLRLLEVSTPSTGAAGWPFQEEMPSKKQRPSFALREGPLAN